MFHRTPGGRSQNISTTVSVQGYTVASTPRDLEYDPRRGSRVPQGPVGVDRLDLVFSSS